MNRVEFMSLLWLSVIFIVFNNNVSTIKDSNDRSRVNMLLNFSDPLELFELYSVLGVYLIKWTNLHYVINLVCQLFIANFFIVDVVVIDCYWFITFINEALLKLRENKIIKITSEKRLVISF